MHTLAVDATAKPIGLIPVEQAISHLAVSHEQACPRCQVLVEEPQQRFRSEKLDIAAPVVLMWQDYVSLQGHQTNQVSRRVLFARDQYTCQYCGFQAKPGKAMQDLTIDHVKPAHLFPSRKKATTWENVVAACEKCNLLKGGRLPRDCGMMPNTDPREPHYVQLRFAGKLNEAQRDYVADFYKLRGGERLVY